ncbi:MAG: glycosyltransferase family 1 protein [Candidatus Poseidoniales archaeon]|nr:MAG: glycosyltransferase family 1 protein [Candidatus Poseidoniales archaeon]
METFKRRTHVENIMHIAMIAGEYPPRWGGIGSVVFHLAGHLASCGHHVSVITRSHKGKTPTQSGVSIIEVPWLKAPMAFTRSYAKNALKALKHLHELDPVDVIHIHLPLASFSRKEFRFMEDNIAPVCSSLHGSWLGEKQGVIRASKAKESATWRNPNDLAIRLTAKYYSKFERAGILESSICVSNSKSTLSEFENWYQPSDDFSCEVVLWGCDHKVFRPPNQDDEDEQLTHEKIRSTYDCGDESALNYLPDTKTPMILAVGRLVARKGYMTLIRALPEILDKHPGARLVIVGRGHMKKRLLKNARKLGVEHALFIRSSMSFDDLAQHFRSADLVVYPSYYEGQGLIPLESLASGTPVVTVNQPPLTEMIDLSVGDLFNSGDPGDLAKSVCRILDSPEDRIQKAKSGRERVLSKYTYEHNAEDFERIYKSILRN